MRYKMILKGPGLSLQVFGEDLQRLKDHAQLLITDRITAELYEQGWTLIEVVKGTFSASPVVSADG